MRILTWNVDGLRNMLNRRNEPLSMVLQKLNAGKTCTKTCHYVFLLLHIA